MLSTEIVVDDVAKIPTIDGTAKAGPAAVRLTFVHMAYVHARYWKVKGVGEKNIET